MLMSLLCVCIGSLEYFIASRSQQRCPVAPAAHRIRIPRAGGRVNLARRTSCQREPESARARGAVRPATIYSCQYSAPVLYVPFARVSYARAPCSVTSGRGGYCCTLFRGYTWPPSTVCTRLRLKHCTHLLARAGSLTGDTLIKSSRFENRVSSLSLSLEWPFL